MSREELSGGSYLGGSCPEGVSAAAKQGSTTEVTPTATQICTSHLRRWEVQICNYNVRLLKSDSYWKEPKSPYSATRCSGYIGKSNAGNALANESRYINNCMCIQRSLQSAWFLHTSINCNIHEPITYIELCVVSVLVCNQFNCYKLNYYFCSKKIQAPPAKNAFAVLMQSRHEQNLPTKVKGDKHRG